MTLFDEISLISAKSESYRRSMAGLGKASSAMSIRANISLAKH